MNRSEPAPDTRNRLRIITKASPFLTPRARQSILAQATIGGSAVIQEPPVLRDIRAAAQEARWGVAIRLIERCRGADANAPELETLLVKAYLQTYDFDAAVDAGERAVKDGNPEVRRAVLPILADAMMLDGLFADALSALREYVTIVGPFSEEELGTTYKRIELIEAGKGPEIREELFALHGLAPTPLPEPRMPLPPLVTDVKHKRAKLQGRYPGAFLESAAQFNPRMQSPFHAYLAYHFKEAPLVRRIAERLMAAGIRVWFFEYLTPPSDYHRLARVMLEGLEQCGCALLFTSPEFAKSTWCEQETIWAKQRFSSQPDRIIEVTLEPNFSVRGHFQLPEGSETVKWRKPQSIEVEKEAVDIIIAALQPYTRVSAPKIPAWPWPSTGASYRARCAPVRVDTCGLKLERWETDSRGGGDQVRFAGQGQFPLSLDLRFSSALSQADIDNILPALTETIDDRRIYQRFVAFAERHIRDWTPLWAKLKQGGIHLSWSSGRPHFAFSYCTGRAWVRRYFVILTDPALPKPVEAVFTFSVPGTPEQAAAFLLEASRMDRIVQSTALLHLRVFRQLRGAAEQMEAGQYDRALSLLQGLLGTDQEWAQVWYATMQCHMLRKDWAEACAVGWRARGLVPDSDPWKARILANLADSLIVAGNHRDARMAIIDALPMAPRDPAVDVAALQMRLAALESSQGELLQQELLQRLESGGTIGVSEKILPTDTSWSGSAPATIAGLQRSPEFSRVARLQPSTPAFIPGLRRALGIGAALCIPAIMVAVFLIRNTHGTLLSSPEGRHLFGLLLAGSTTLLAGYNSLALLQNRHYEDNDQVPFVGLTLVANVALLAATLGVFFGHYL